MSVQKIRHKSFSLYHKFAVAIILIGLVPMMLLSTLITKHMIEEYRNALSTQYEQAAGYVSSSLSSMFETYNTISKMPYYYNLSADETTYNNYLSFDNFRKIVYGEEWEPELKDGLREKEMNEFLNYLGSTDSNIVSTHFLARDLDGTQLAFHHSMNGTYFRNEVLFEEVTGYAGFDTSSNKMILIPTHKTGYFNGISSPVFTIARNYFDLRGEIGKTPYVGTLFIDVNLNKVEKIFRSVKFSGNEKIYVTDQNGACFYSSEKGKTGTDISAELSEFVNTDRQLVIRTEENVYGISVIVVMDTSEAFRSIKNLQKIIYMILGCSVITLLAASIYFSKRLTKPIHEMMEQMDQIENGNFDIQLPVYSTDEIGILSERFNQMSSALKKYINESYVAKIRQNEAELTALKSQIYPHFLYNTLEIIRMTALEDDEKKVPEMIEALSEQIHYLIGPVQDMVPLEKEIDIVRKYVYLLNCRITGKVQLIAHAEDAEKQMVPRLILQPIVENAYVHGIKPKNGKGSVMIEVKEEDQILEISVMDNGTGMDSGTLDGIRRLLEGDEPGVKNENDWQSIGLKNVHDRIRFLYGDDFGIEVTSTPGVGTMVRITIPENL